MCVYIAERLMEPMSEKPHTQLDFDSESRTTEFTLVMYRRIQGMQLSVSRVLH